MPPKGIGECLIFLFLHRQQPFVIPKQGVEKVSRKKVSLGVLILSKSRSDRDTLVKILREDSRFYPIFTASSEKEAMDIFMSDAPALAVINLPSQSALEELELPVSLVKNHRTGILILCSKEQYDSISEKVDDLGILVLARPTHPQMVLGAVKLLYTVYLSLSSLMEKTISLQNKYDDIRLINRAKLILIERFKMTELEAHKYIEKQAMDSCTTRRKVAEKIIRTYED